MPSTPTQPGTASSNRDVYSVEAEAQDRALIALNAKAMESCSETEFADPEGDEPWAKDGLGDSKMLLGNIRVRYGDPEAGSEQAMDLGREYVLVSQI